jgi:glutamyl/glutaminyl-tRNA synthetase
VVVDDFLMKITHAFRGEEWLPSAPVHILVWKNLFGLDKMPKWAHLPLILKPDGNGKLSKRDGDRLGFPVFAMDWKDSNTNETTIGFKERGFLPAAFVNLLAMLGWNDGTDHELFSLDNLIEKKTNLTVSELFKQKGEIYFRKVEHEIFKEVIQNDDNYKNILQVKIQKEFKVTPHYLEIEQDIELGYKMGVYICLGQAIHNVSHKDAVDFSFFKNFKAVQDFILENNKVLIFMGEGQHKIKRKAEQIACNEALNFLEVSVIPFSQRLV